MELTLGQALQKGIEAHKAGQVQEADRLYTAILKAQPKHPDANHNMGILAVGAGKVQEALPFFKTALEANPNTAQFWLSYIDALIKLERLADAKAMFDQAKSNGAKGDGFDVLAKRLDGVETTKTMISQNQDPPHDLLQPIINLYSQGQFLQALDQIALLLQKFSHSVILYSIQGAANAGLGQLDATIESYNKALDIKPDYAEAYNNIGAALKDQGKWEKAIEAYEKAIGIKPNYADPYYNIGVALNSQGKLEKAIEAYNRALALKPDYAEAYTNMGNAHREQGKLEEAIEAYGNALRIKPDYAHAQNNMGVTLHEQGKLKEAIKAYNKALVIKPDYAEAFNNKGTTLHDQGKIEEAIGAYNKALVIKPDYAGACINMGIALKGITFQKPNPSLQKTINLILDKRACVSPRTIAPTAIRLLKLEPNLQKHLGKSAIDSSRQSLGQVILELSELPLLLKLMSVCPLADLGLENLFKEVRAGLLLSCLSFKDSPEVLKFQAAIALQCFTNEYIYDQSKIEEKEIRSLEASVKELLSKGEQPSPQAILCLASYQALHEYEWCELLFTTKEIVQVFIRQVSEPRQERQLRSTIPVLGEITDGVSAKVREQYEENPYPRWMNLGLLLNPLPISKVVDNSEIRLFDNTVCNVSSPNILVAGCGTGQHSISTAARFKNSKVLAVDLSLSSLAYAKRKTEELGIQGIKYMQADILDLGKLDRQFDIVESVGVLHHMNDPMVGWKVLTECLRLGGLMRIGLYSEFARQSIIEVREEISRAGISSNEANMRTMRAEMITSVSENHKQVKSLSDFYSISELRDLLFHVQEHRFNIPQLKNCLAELGLKFCGFENDQIVTDFKQANTSAEDPYDLDKWHAYEKAKPKTFLGMYQFWCQKVA